MSKLINPYVNTEMSTRVSLMPNQLNNDIYINLKQNLKRRVEAKCNKYGYVTQVFKILSHTDGVIPPENLMAAVTYNVTYSCQLCIPMEDTQIICKIKIINKDILTAENGPILVVKMHEMNETKFAVDNMDNLIYVDTKEKIVAGMYMKITVKTKRFYQGDSVIYVIGKLDDIPSEAEVKKYFERPTQNIEVEEVIDIKPEEENIIQDDELVEELQDQQIDKFKRENRNKITNYVDI
ncbi:MAG: DNA-directed RNA polymerase, subunit E'/Rpb8 [Faunusvirus sp.]|jgi:DNA-directed RNA polymerase subunit E'/Rpb7|uniref:DNA-directed RNA polymerase, subunit E'/Rpb8 n=1 Tax=Faunusvirus sp. TaxID=2487766 RepID=A0A3G5A229_9VIRU|nr:MAG: DNA-directed RNA polymerase, subunit E'/Rpb8 [Faunusvirus sp.]